MKEDFVVISELSIPSDYNELTKVESLIEEVCLEHLADQDVYGNVLIAVTEAVNNAVQHGNQLDRTRLVKLSVEESPQILSFIVEDMGEGFDFENLPDPTAPENIEKENGRGIFLMRSLSDNVEFESNGSVVVISFNK